MTHPRMNGVTLRISKRVPSEFSLTPADHKRRDNLLRTAWMAIVCGGSRPYPTAAWNETATGDVTPWRYPLHVLRCSVIAALVQDDRQLAQKRLEAIRAFLKELDADISSLVPSGEEASIIADALAETHVQGAGDEAAMALVASPDPATAEKAIIPLARHHERLGKLLERCRRHARQARPTSMVVIR